MPTIGESSFRPAYGLVNPHVQTLAGAALRQAPLLSYRRERVETADGDFFDVDWAGDKDGGRLLLLLHGLESSSNAGYIRRMAHAGLRRGWTVAALNFRGCSGEPNRLYRAYHSGATEDVRQLIDRVAGSGRFIGVSAVGYSLGGNVLLKALGEEGAGCRLTAAAAVSVPCDLASSAAAMAHKTHSFYMRRFVVALRAKLASKRHLFPPGISLETFREMRTFRDIDTLYTAPAHGFLDAEDYWRQCSGCAFLPAIRRPVLLLQADDDPFLGPGCYPCAEAAASQWVTLDITRGGGHVGFVARQRGWLENRVLDFLEAVPEPDTLLSCRLPTFKARFQLSPRDPKTDST